MERVRGVEPTAFDSRCRQVPLEGGDVFRRARHDAERRRIHRREPQPLAISQTRPQLIFGQRHRQHHPFRHLLHQPAAGRHQVERVLQLQNARHARRDELADAVADARRRLHPPRPPELGEGVLDDE